MAGILFEDCHLNMVLNFFIRASILCCALETLIKDFTPKEKFSLSQIMLSFTMNHNLVLTHAITAVPQSTHKGGTESD